MADGRNLEKVKELAAYRVSEEMYVEEMDSRAMVLEHIKSGARIFLMSNEDENKVFYIGFRTPPDDSTGLPHILEHSVLEGSDKFPVKDPFVELVKGSLNTFLNAMTYPDKTVYPSSGGVKLKERLKGAFGLSLRVVSPKNIKRSSWS